MIEIGVNQTWEGDDGLIHSRTIAAMRVDDRDPNAEPEILQTIDARTLAVVMKVLRDIANDHASARADFGDPAAG